MIIFCNKISFKESSQEVAKNYGDPDGTLELKKIIGLLYLLIIFAKYLEGAQLHFRGIMFWMKGFSQHDFKENVSTIIWSQV